MTSQAHIPVLGLLGGIASGKSFYARLFAEQGCLVIDADALVAEVYRDPEVLRTLQEWWGPGVIDTTSAAAGGMGGLDRKAVARIVFADPAQRRRLEGLTHPRVLARREQIMNEAKSGATPPRAFVWDIPLLIETGLHDQCDAVLFVDTPVELRRNRARGRGWDDAELARREAAQVPLDRKRALADHLLAGDLPEPEARARVKAVLDQVCARGR